MAIDMQPIDYMHGLLKNLMYETEQKLLEVEQFDGSDYLEGYMDALVKVYGLTYDISFMHVDGKFDE